MRGRENELSVPLDVLKNNNKNLIYYLSARETHLPLHIHWGYLYTSLRAWGVGFFFLSLVCMPGPSGYLHTNAECQHLESVFFGKFLCEWSTTCGCKHCRVHARSLVCATEPPVVASEDKQTNNQEKGLTTT